jgi:DNA-binding NtrC family response regulator
MIALSEMKSRVLIVEDEALVAMLLEDMLIDAGYAVAGTASAIQQALDFVVDAGSDFDVAILDVNLRGKPIFPVAEALSQAGKPFVFATGYGAGSLPEAWRDRPILQKPFGAGDVERVLAAALAKRAATAP